MKRIDKKLPVQPGLFDSLTTEKKTKRGRKPKKEKLAESVKSAALPPESVKALVITEKDIIQTAENTEPETDLTISGRIVARMAESVTGRGYTEEEANFALTTLTGQLKERVYTGNCANVLYNTSRLQFVNELFSMLDRELLRPDILKQIKNLSIFEIIAIQEKLMKQKSELVTENWDFLRRPVSINANLGKKVSTDFGGITRIVPTRREQIRSIVDAVLAFFNSSSDSGVIDSDEIK
jgi:hypothetical protein